MVVVQRSEVNRIRALCLTSMTLAGLAFVGIVLVYPESSTVVRIGLLPVAIALLVVIFLSSLQLWSHPIRSQVVLFEQEGSTVLATNSIHEGYKLRFLRDILGETVSAFSDEDRGRWRALEEEGFYAAIYVRNPRKTLLARLCTMIFDDVFVAGRKNIWEHLHCGNTSEPTLTDEQSPRFKTHKGIAPHSTPGFVPPVTR